MRRSLDTLYNAAAIWRRCFSPGTLVMVLLGISAGCWAQVRHRCYAAT
jgi:hypothetical protein